jgi:hypothetical protein
LHFDAYPAGARAINSNQSNLAAFWTSTKSTFDQNSDKYNCRVIYPMIDAPYTGSRVIREDANPVGGMSVRCVKNN